MEYLFIYLLQLGDLFEGLAVLFAISLVIMIIITIGIFISENTYNEEHTDSKKFAKISIVLLICMSLFGLFPTKQTLLLIGGTYIGKKAVNQVVTDEKIKKIDTIINLELDKRIKELKESK